MNNALSISDFVNRILTDKPLSRPKPQSTPIPENVSIPGMKTVYDLWKPNYKWMIVKNVVNGKVMYITGKYGKMFRQNKKLNGMIVGRYSNRDHNGQYTYTEELYPVWDADKPIWQLIKAVSGLSPEEQYERDEELRAQRVKEQEAQLEKEKKARQEAYQKWLQEEAERRLKQEREAKVQREKEHRERDAQQKALDEACLEDVLRIIDHQDAVARDCLGRHWVRCKVCGKVMLDDMFTTYGGPNEFNLGVCRECYRQKKT